MNKRELDAEFERRVRSLGYAVLLMQRLAQGGGDDGVGVTEIRFKLDADAGTSVLAIIKGVRGDERVITFVGSLDLSTVILTVAKKAGASQLRWREDRPYGG